MSNNYIDPSDVTARPHYYRTLVRSTHISAAGLYSDVCNVQWAEPMTIGSYSRVVKFRMNPHTLRRE
jgi:hypothetical protein